MTDGMMGQMTGSYFEGASCPIQSQEGVFALRPMPIVSAGEGWRTWWRSARGWNAWGIDGHFRSYEPFQLTSQGSI